MEQRQPWDQRFSETDSEYRTFRRWLETEPRPPPSEPELVSRQEWMRRAEAYDLIHSMPASPGARLAATVDMLTAGTFIQAGRWLEQLQTRHEEVDPAQISRILETIARLKEVADAGRERQAPNLEGLDEYELLVLDESYEIAKKLGK